MQTRPDLDWDDVQVVLALFGSGSLKRAAADLDVNISTVSRRLDRLEAALGRRLFDRTPDGTLPTAAAERLRPHAERMAEAAQDFARGLDGFETEPTGIVTLAAPPGLVDHFLAPALPRLIAKYPKLRVVIESSVGYADLARREADIALRISRPSSGDLICTRLTSQSVCVIAAPSVCKRLGRLSDTAATTWVTWRSDWSHLPDAQWITAHVPKSQIVLRTNSMTAQLEAVRAGIGAMVAARPYARLARLTEVPCAPELRRSLDTLPEGELWLVGHRALGDVARIRVVWDWLKTWLDV